MLLRKYYLLVCLAEGVRFFDLNLRSHQGYTSLCELLSLQKSLTLSMDEYLAQDIKVNFDAYQRRALASPFSHVFVLVPDAWLRSIETRLPLSDSTQVKSLAALALASEVSHLTPEKVCYRYYAEPQQEEWQLNVTTAPKQVYDVIGFLLPKLSRLKGVISHQDCRDEICCSQTSTFKLNKLAALTLKPSYEQTNRSAQYGRRWILFLCIAFVSQLLLLFSYEAEKQTLEKAQFNLEQQKLKTVSLAKPIINSASKVARELMQTLPQGVRVNSITSEGSVSWLVVSIESEQLLSLFPRWQGKWKKYQLSLMDEWQQPIRVDDINSQFSTTGTRSVLRVVIQIQKQ